MKVTTFFNVGISLGFLLFSAFAPQPPRDRSNNQFVVVLDAGHGGHDPGNLGNGYLEKDIALGIVLAAGKALEKETDIKVVYTRMDDRFVDLYVRGEVANKAKADLFVSVHCDSHSSDANGAGTFVLGLHANKQNFEIAKKENSVIYLEDNYESRYADYDINSPESIIGLTIMQEEFLDQSILLGKMMQDNFTKRLKRKDRKVKQAGFIVLHQTFMPSVLVETGFLTNKNEGAYLNSKKGQAEMGNAIADAIIQYKTNLWSGRSLLAEEGENVITAVPEVKPDTAEKVMAVTAIQAKEQIEPEVESPTKDKTPTDEIVPEKAQPEDVAKAVESTEVSLEEREKAAIEKELKTEQPAGEIAGIKEPNTNGSETIVETATKTEGLLEMKAEDKQNVATKTAEDKVNAIANEPETKVEKEIETAKSTNEGSTEKPEATVAINIIFKVQILASSKELPLRSENFNGLSTISKEPYKNLFRYMYGKTNSYEQAKMLKSNADLKGYDTSFIVAYKDGVRIPMKQAMKYISE